jgi:hypothetical protein
VTEPFQPAREAGCNTGLADPIEVRLSQFAVPEPLGKHVIGGNEDLMGDDKCRAEGAAASP